MIVGSGGRLRLFDREHGFGDTFAFAVRTARGGIQEIIERCEATLTTFRRYDEQLLVGWLKRLGQMLNV